MKSTFATILGIAGISLLKKVSGSKNQEKPFTFTMTFFLEGEEGALDESQYNRTILNQAWLMSVGDFIKGTNDFIMYGDENTPAQMLLEYRQFLQERIPTYMGECIDNWLTDYIYDEEGEWEEYANTVEDVSIQWILPDDFQVLKNSGPEGQDQVMFTCYFSLDQIIRLTKKEVQYFRSPTLLEAIKNNLIASIEDWSNVIGYNWMHDIAECEVFVTDTKLEVDMDGVDPSQRRLVQEILRENQKSELRKF